MPPTFDHDFFKGLGNAWKHGISLAEAEALWLDPGKRYFRLKPVNQEHRYALVARHEEKVWTCVFTLRGSAYRLISCRRARPKESAYYHRRGVRPPV